MPNMAQTRPLPLYIYKVNLIFPFCRRRMRQHVRQNYAPRGSESELSDWVHGGTDKAAKKVHYQHTNNVLELQPTTEKLAFVIRFLH
jgi:hypothetical protein